MAPVNANVRNLLIGMHRTFDLAEAQARWGSHVWEKRFMRLRDWFITRVIEERCIDVDLETMYRHNLQEAPFFTKHMLEVLLS